MMRRFSTLFWPLLFLLASGWVLGFERVIGLPWVWWWMVWRFLRAVRSATWEHWLLAVGFGWWLSMVYILPLWVGVAALLLIRLATVAIENWRPGWRQNGWLLPAIIGNVWLLWWLRMGSSAGWLILQAIVAMVGVRLLEFWLQKRLVERRLRP